MAILDIGRGAASSDAGLIKRRAYLMIPPCLSCPRVPHSPLPGHFSPHGDIVSYYHSGTDVSARSKKKKKRPVDHSAVGGS